MQQKILILMEYVLAILEHVQHQAKLLEIPIIFENKRADMVICGGISLCLDPIAIARLCRLNALELTKENVKSNCAPFDKHRAGFTIGEGCILFMMERESDAKKETRKYLQKSKDMVLQWMDFR